MHKKKKNRIIICGGTAFYTKAFLYGYIFPDSLNINKSYRQKLERDIQDKGEKMVWEQLKQIDELSAKRIHPNDHQRLIRALEIYEQSGKKPSEFRVSTDQARKDVFLLGLTADRQDIYKTINERVLQMIKYGLIEEVEGLLKAYSDNCVAFQALGYKETIQYLQDKLTKDQLVTLIQKRTRHFAKHQLTWYRQFESMVWIEKE